MNSESVRRNCQNGGIQRWFAITARGKLCDFAFLTSSGGEVLQVFHDICAGHSPSHRKKLACVLNIRVCALNRANMVMNL